MFITGVDVGLSGALAGIEDGKLVSILDMPTVAVVRNKKIKKDIDYIGLGIYFSSLPYKHAFIEKVNSMPGQGLSSTFAFGKSAGAVLGAAGACRIEINEVSPLAWKKYFNLLGEAKDEARQLAIKLFPESKHEFSRKKDIGKADAALIALYGWKKLTTNDINGSFSF